MKGKIEDVIPTCQFGNRHISMEFDSPESMEGALEIMNDLYRRYHNFIGKAKEKTESPKEEPKYENTTFKPKPYEKSRNFFNKKTQKWEIKGGTQ